MNSSTLGLIALVIVIGAGVLWFRGIQNVSIPKNRGAFLGAVAVALLLSVSALFGSPGWIGGIAAGLAAFFSLFFVITSAISAQKLSNDAIKVGDTLPGFSAVTANGETFDSKSLAGSPALIKFFRGHW